MRVSSTRILAWAACAAASLAAARSSPAQQIDVERTLKENRPIHRQWVDYDTPATPEALKACKAEIITETRTVDGQPKKRAVGVLIRDGQGRALRRFLDRDGDGNTDTWCFYKDGFEVYRDVDYDGDQRVNESRWMNTAGTRIAVVENGRIRSWRRLSAEEATQVLVDALVAGDLELLETVMATPEELEALGLPEGLVAEVREASTRRDARVSELVNQLSGWGWDQSTVWMRFNAVRPHLIPADASENLKENLVLYEDAAVFAGPPEPSDDALMRTAYLHLPELIQIGSTWKLISMPIPVNPEKPEIVTRSRGLRGWLYRGGSGAADVADVGPELQKALEELAEYDEQAVEVFERGDPKEIARYHYNRVLKLRDVIQAASPSQRREYEEEVIRTLAAAYQTGEYPAAKEALERSIDKGGPLASLAAYVLIPAEYSLRVADDGDVADAQKRWVADLERFLEDYPNAAERPDALFQLASIKEFNGRENEAKALYEELAEDHPETEPGRKAAGALRRLNGVGQPFRLTGATTDGASFDARSSQGRHLLVLYGSASSPQTLQRLPEFVNLHQRRRSDLNVIAVNLDGDEAQAEPFLEAAGDDWPTILAPGGIDGELAEDYGIISLPTIFLIGPDGKMINNDVDSAAEVEAILDEALAKSS